MLIKFVTLSLVLSNLVSSSLEDKPYDFRPDSRKFEINEGDDYFIGFDEIDKKTIFTHCYIESDIFNADYPIISSNSVYELGNQRDSSSGFTTYNNTGICAFVYYGVDDKVPLKWTITGYDTITKTNFTEQVTISFYYNMPLYVDQLLALPTASVLNFFDSGQTKLKKCTLGFDNTTIDLNMDAIKVYNEDNALKSRLNSLGGGRCGYKINKIVQGDNGRDMTLYATDELNKIYRHGSVMTVYSQTSDDLRNRTLEVFLGAYAFVICGKEATDGSHSNTDQKFCDLYNPQGELVSHEHMCEFHLDIVTINDLGTWKCLVGYQYVMENLVYTTTLVEKKSERVDLFTNDTPDYLIIGCQKINFEIISTDFCTFTRPDGKKFTVVKGTATEYYNSISTDMLNGKCSLEILKPLREEDKGTWKCELRSDASAPQGISGAFLNVEKSSENVSYNKHIKKNVQMDNSFTVDCNFPFSSDYCYIIAPNGTQFKAQNPLYVTSGVCYLKIDKATSTDNGTWTCSIAQSNGVPDEKITVEVSIIDLKVLYANAEALVKEEVELICNTNGIPIEYCRFVSPGGNSYSLRMENSISTKIGYKGRGLEYGDCGVKISTVDYADAGQWTCHISSGRSDYTRKTDVAKKVELTVSSPAASIPTIAESVGIAVGVLVAVIVAGGFVFYRYSKRRQARRNIQSSVQYSERTSDASRSSGEAVILAVPQSTYNTAP